MKKIRVKLSFEWKSLPIERQTPNQAGEWGNCKFYINQNVKECDYWVVYGQLLKTETTVCARENTLLISDEPPHILQYEKSFTDQKFCVCVVSYLHAKAILADIGCCFCAECIHDN